MIRSGIKRSGIIRAGVIRNPGSARNARTRASLSGDARALGLDYAEPATIEELSQVLDHYLDREVSLLAVDGGDGTVREVMTQLLSRPSPPPLRLAIMPAGKINLIARDVGWESAGPGALARLALAARHGGDGLRLERRAALRLDRQHVSPLYGMFLGAGAFTAAWRLANDELHPRGVLSAPAVAAAFALTLAQTLRHDGADLLAGEKMALDGEDGSRFLFLCTTLEKLMMGVWPFWERGGGMHYLRVDAPPKRLRRAMLPLLRGRPQPWMPASGYGSGRAGRLEIRLGAPVILDGEAFAPGADGRILLSPGPQLEFLRP